MLLEVVHLLLNVDGGGLLVDVERYFYVIFLEGLKLVVSLACFHLGVVSQNPLRVLKRLLDRFVSLLRDLDCL